LGVADQRHAVLHHDLVRLGEAGQFPPCSAAMSTITEPGFMLFTMSSVTSTALARPGFIAVVTTDVRGLDALGDERRLALR